MIILQCLMLLCAQGNILSSEFDYNKETEGIFIERTQQLPPSKHYFNGAFNYFIEPSGGTDNFYVTCPFNRDCAILRPAGDKAASSQFVLISSQGNVCGRQFFDYKNIHACALGANREMFAVIYESQNWRTTNFKLLIQHIDTKRFTKYTLPKTFEIASVKHSNPAIAFDKQNAHVILWGVDTTIRGSYKQDFYGVPALDYMMFRL